MVPPPQEQVPLGGHAFVNPQSMTDGEVKLTFLYLTQSMTTQSQAVATLVQAMTAHANREI